MHTRTSILTAFLFLTVAALACGGTAAEIANRSNRPNILLITMDDMNWDSIGAYGCPLPNISPHIDSLADSGLRFQYAYVQTSSCVPSRTTLQTGRYPHSTGVLSFFNVDASFQSLPEILTESGYYTACVNKPRDSSLTDDYDRYWDYHLAMKDAQKRGAPTYAESVKEALTTADARRQPFYCVVNIADPHKPFFNDPASNSKGFDEFEPSKKFSADEIEISGFLPDLPEVRKELQNYYNSVKRGDDCVGAVLKICREIGVSDNTVVFFLSDHGMPLPFAKSSLYPDGVRIPWIVVWPDKIPANSVNDGDMVSAIDLMPTILDVVGVKHPEGLQGHSLLPIFKNELHDSRDCVFVEFNDNAGGHAYPMRAIHTKDHVYIFNAWGSGKNTFNSAATWYQSENAMKRHSASDPELSDRYQFLLHRCVEEFYDLGTDPHCLTNRINDPQFKAACDTMRSHLADWMRATDDYLAEAFLARDDTRQLQKIYEQLDAQALARAESTQWKRYKNRSGGTGKNTSLFSIRTPNISVAPTPLMLEKGALLFNENFSGTTSITKPRWWVKQGTQWSIRNGVLEGKPADSEYQRKRRQIGHHLGDVPRIGLGQLPDTYVISFRFQIDNRPGNAKVPLIEFGHHISRVHFGNSAATLLTNNEKTTHTQIDQFRLKPYHWHHVLAEVGTEDLVIQVTDDSNEINLFHAHDFHFKNAKNRSLEIAGTIQGTAKLDDIKVWSAGKTKDGWLEAVEAAAATAE